MRVCVNEGAVMCRSANGAERIQEMREGMVFKVDGHELQALFRGGEIVGFGIQHPAKLAAFTPKTQEYLRAGVGAALLKLSIGGPVSVHND